MPFGGNVWVTSQIGEGPADLLLGVGNLLPGRIERMGGLIELRLRRDAGGEQTSLAIVLLLRVALGVSCGAQFDQPLPIGRLERRDLQPRISKACRGVADGDAERRVVQFK